jgi:hypothetical protein
MGPRVASLAAALAFAASLSSCRDEAGAGDQPATAPVEDTGAEPPGLADADLEIGVGADAIAAPDADAAPDATKVIETTKVTLARNWSFTFGPTTGLEAGPDLVVETAVAPAHGSLVPVASARVGQARKYSPEYFFTGEDAFEYRVLRGAELLRHARVEVAIDRGAWVDAGGTIKRLTTIAASNDGVDDALELRDVREGLVIGSRRLGGRTSAVAGSIGALTNVEVTGQSETALHRFGEGGALLGSVTDALGVHRGLVRMGSTDTIWSAPGGTDTWLQGRTAGGVVIGAARGGPFGPQRRAIRADTAGGEATLLGPTDAVSSMAMGQAGATVVGYFVDALQRRRPFVQDQEGVSSLDAPADADAEASDVDASGVIVGSSWAPTTPRQPLVWRQRRPSAVRLPAALEGALLGLDDAGAMVGWSRDARGTVAGLWLDDAPAAPMSGFWSETEEPAHPTLTHACGHGRSGPFLDVTASATPALAEASVLERRHILYRSTLSVDGAARRGFHRIRVTQNGELSIYTGALVPVRLHRDGTIVPIALGFRFRNCPYLRFVHEYRVTAGDYVLEVGPTASESAEILLENDWAFTP